MSHSSMLCRSILFLLLISLHLKLVSSDDDSSETCTSKSTDEDKNECLMGLAVNNLAINRPRTKESTICKDFWGRETVSFYKNKCVYIQAIQLDPSSQKAFINPNAHSPNDWELMKKKKDFSSEDINHFKEVTKECIDSIKDDGKITMSTFTTWKFEGLSKVTLFLVYCCSKSSCFKDPKTQNEFFVFPQCASGNLNQQTTSVENWITVRSSINVTLPKERKDKCYFKRLFDDNSKIDFDKKCNALLNSDISDCIIEVIPAQENDSAERYICCAILTNDLNKTHFPLAFAIQNAEQMRQLLTADLIDCFGLKYNNKCYAYIDLISGSFSHILENAISSKFISKSDAFYTQDGIQCQYAWIKSNTQTEEDSLIPYFRCDCDIIGTGKCDDQFYKSNFVDLLKQTQLGKHCKETIPNKSSPYIACTLTMEVVHDKIKLTHGGATESEFDNLAKLKNDVCVDVNKDNRKAICYCRLVVDPSGNRYCNTLENEAFKDKYVEMNKVMIQPVSKLKIFESICNSKEASFSMNQMSSEVEAIKYVNFDSHVLCYSNIIDPTKNEVTDPEEKTFFDDQLNPDMKIFAQIVCDQITVEEQLEKLDSNCNCGFIEEPNMQSIVCCCKASERLNDN